MLNLRTLILGLPRTCPQTGLQNEPKYSEKPSEFGTVNWTPYLISFNAKNKEISFTEKGIKAYQSQEFQLAYANMLQAKSACNLAKTSLWIAVSTLFITAFGIIITIILK